MGGWEAPGGTGSPWTCDHAEHAIRARPILGGAVRAEMQCLRCGKSIRAVKAPAPVETLPPWDFDLSDRFDEQARAELEARRQANDRAKDDKSREWWEWYNAHLRSEKWRVLRRKVLRRADGKCEGCAEREPAEVHHLTYDHVGDEMLFELVALCSPCHDKITAMDRARRGK